MYTNVNLAAPVAVLAFLGTGFILFVAAVIVIHALLVRKLGRAKLISAAMLILAALYFAAILAFSFASQEKVLARGEEKHFCEIDCHLAYSIVNIQQAKTLGSLPNQATARGLYTIITVKTRFDETTTAPWRGDKPLRPNSRVVTLLDEHGNSYWPSADGQRALEVSKGSGTPLTTPLRPGESYTTELVFDLPPEVKSAKLLINEGEFITHFIIGHENSLLHKKTEFRLDLPPVQQLSATAARSTHNGLLWQPTLPPAATETKIETIN